MLAQSSNRHRLAWLLFTLFALMQVNLVVFRHGHRLADGRIVSHAHPFWPDGKGPIKSNPHSASELALLDAVTNGSFAPEAEPVFEFEPLRLLSAEPVFAHFARPIVRFVSTPSLRGPPAAFVAACFF